MLYKFTIILLPFLLITITSSIQAQMPEIVIPAKVTLKTNPLSPRPGETVTVTATVSGFDEILAEYSWYLNGKLIENQSGRSKKAFGLTPGAIGEKYHLRVVVRQNNQQVEEELTLEVGDFELVWSANTYVPPFYAGKALPIFRSTIFINAIINFGEGIYPQELLYRWEADGDVLTGDSGQGKDTLKLFSEKPEGAAHHVKLNIFNKSRTISAEKEIIIPINQPHLLIYPLEKTEPPYYHNYAVKHLEMSPGSKRGFLALPYFFEVETWNNLEYEWSFQEIKLAQSNLSQQNVLEIKLHPQLKKNVNRELVARAKSKEDFFETALETVGIKIK